MHFSKKLLRVIAYHKLCCYSVEKYENVQAPGAIVENLQNA